MKFLFASLTAIVFVNKNCLIYRLIYFFIEFNKKMLNVAFGLKEYQTTMNELYFLLIDIHLFIFFLSVK